MPTVFGSLSRRYSLRRTYAGVSVAAGLFTALLSGWAIVLVASQHQGAAPCVAVLTMIVPIAFARRSPATVAAILATATLLNELFFGHLVRCGPGLPAAFYVAYVIAVGTSGRDKLGGSQIALMWPATLFAFGAGVIVSWRSALVIQLRERNAQLRDQRERTARVAVATDQARIRGDLIQELRTQIEVIAQAATEARAGTAPTEASLVAIERTGRAALDRMRDIVGTMHSAPTDPEPGLDALGELLKSATTCGVRLSIEGDPRALPASIELSSYRIVERLVAALEDDPAARAQVRVSFGTDALELSVTGPLARDHDTATSFSGILDRAAVHGGTVRLAEPDGRLNALIRLPLVTSHA
jgi:signal transduction histidine kinase